MLAQWDGPDLKITNKHVVICREDQRGAVRHGEGGAEDRKGVDKPDYEHETCYNYEQPKKRRVSWIMHPTFMRPTIP
jgi:hypothetical protein